MGRNVLISGASHGIGAATAIAFAKDGCNVGINYHNNRAGAEETAAECRKYGVDAQIYCADIGCREQAVGMMRDFIEHFGTVDVLINNAGGALKMPKGEFCDMPLDYWDSQIALNLSGAAYLSHEAIKNMKEHNIPGRIVNISSIHGSVTWVKRKALPYCAGKGGIEMFTKTLAIEVAKYGIRVNCVAPGVIKTDMLDALPSEVLPQLAEETPLRRLGRPEDIAAAVSYLASDDASFVTGQVLTVDGGFIL